MNGGGGGGEDASAAIRQQVYMSELQDNCIVRGVQGLVGGAIVGVLFGNLFATFESNPLDNPAAGAAAASASAGASGEAAAATTTAARMAAWRKTLGEVGASVAKRSWSGAKLCGVFGGVYAAAECCSETVRRRRWRRIRMWTQCGQTENERTHTHAQSARQWERHKYTIGSLDQYNLQDY